MTELIRVLAPRGRDAEVVAGVLMSAGLAVEIVDGCAAVARGFEAAAGVVATEEAVAGPELDALLAAVAAQPAWSDMPFIVLATRQAGPRGAAQAAVLEGLGNPVLLERPLNRESLASAARSAVRARARQLAARGLYEALEAQVAERTAALAASEAQSRAIFEGFPECMFVVAVTNDGRFLYEGYNPTAERLAGVRSEQIRGLPAEDFMAAEQAARVTAQFARCVAGGKTTTFTEELRFPAVVGTFETTMTPLRDGSGRIHRLLSVSRDVTARLALEQRVRQAQKMEAVGQLTGGVAHDFNNLLQVVLSGLTLMERVQDPVRRTQLADSVRRAAQRGGELTKRLLTVARRQALRPEPVAFGAWISDGAGELLSRALRGNVVTAIAVADDLPPIEVDASELELAILNLAVNARDAMPDGGTLTIAAERVDLTAGADPDGLVGRFIQVSMTDTGVGMSAETQARVFEPFFTTKGVGEGTGLGLAQVYGFARQSGGGVRLRSVLGQGTTVSLLLPVSTRAAVPAAPAAEEAGPGRSAAILVCEDDDSVAAVVEDMLRTLGHMPTRVGTAAAALDALGDGRGFELLFTDVMMPGGMDGLALAREAGRRRPGLPVLLTTGYTGGGAADVPLGMPLLRKPYRIDELQRALGKALGQVSF